jgi:hypothetical protein
MPSAQENVVPTNCPRSHTPPDVGEVIVAVGARGAQLIVTEPFDGVTADDGAVAVETPVNDCVVKFEPAPPPAGPPDPTPPPPPPK